MYTWKFAVELLLQKNSKAWYRRGVARAAFGFLDEAKADLSSAARLDPRNVEIRNELKKVNVQLGEGLGFRV